jgi:RHS repeat-associated protein
MLRVQRKLNLYII